MNKRTIIHFAERVSLAFLCLSIILFAAVKLLKAKQTEAPASFVATYRHSVQQANETPKVEGTSIRAVSAQGEWKETSYDLATGATKTRYVDQLATYKLKGDTIQYVDSASNFHNLNRQARSDGFFHSHTLFVREDSVAGLKTFVLKSNMSNGWTENHYSPKTGFTALKTIEFAGSTGMTNVKEVVSIQFRALADNEYKLPNREVKFDEAERLIQTLHASNSEANRNAAIALAQRLEALKKKLSVQ